MNQEAPLDAHYEGERQRCLAGNSAQVAAHGATHVALRHARLKVQFRVKIQFGHDNTLSFGACGSYAIISGLRLKLIGRL